MTFSAPTPFEEALAFARKKGVLPTSLSSAELSKLQASVKRRAVFSARLDEAHVLQTLREDLLLLAGGGTDAVGRIRSISEAKARLLEVLDAIGYRATEDDNGTIKDFSTDARRQLMVETNVLDTLGFGRWKAGQDPVALDVNPCWELVRLRDSKVPRDWEERWTDACEGEFDGATDPAESGRMVARKDHLVWQNLGDGVGDYDDTLGNPWPPFAFNSGMGVLDVTRDDAIELGLITEDEKVTGQDLDLNGNLDASADSFDPDISQWLAAGDRLEVKDGVLQIANNRKVEPKSILVFNYDPDQMRDEHGRWSKEGAESDFHDILPKEYKESLIGSGLSKETVEAYAGAHNFVENYDPTDASTWGGEIVGKISGGSFQQDAHGNLFEVDLPATEAMLIEHHVENYDKNDPSTWNTPDGVRISEDSRFNEGKKLGKDLRAIYRKARDESEIVYRTKKEQLKSLKEESTQRLSQAKALIKLIDTRLQKIGLEENDNEIANSGLRHRLQILATLCELPEAA